jgi:hypothetical protein
MTLETTSEKMNGPITSTKLFGNVRPAERLSTENGKLKCIEISLDIKGKRQMRNRFKDLMMQKMYEHFMTRSSIPPREGSTFWELFWNGYNGVGRIPYRNSIGYAIWRAGKDRKTIDTKEKK